MTLKRSSADTGAAAISAAALGTTTGAAAFSPLKQYSKMMPRTHTLTSKASHRSLTSIQSPAISSKTGKIIVLCSRKGNWVS